MQNENPCPICQKCDFHFHQINEIINFYDNLHTKEDEEK